MRALQESWLVEAHGMRWLKYQFAETEWLRTAIVGLATSVVAVLGFFGFKGRGKQGT
jgi:hypothetical protein